MHAAVKCGVLIGASFVALSGCGSKPVFEIDGLALAPSEEVLTEYPLGEYKIPIPLVEEHAGEVVSRRNHVQLNFKLYAMILPAEVAHAADAWSRHEGNIRDQVIRVCRNATVDELSEPELATLKARLIDSLTGPLGNQPVRQLLLSDVVTEQL